MLYMSPNISHNHYSSILPIDAVIFDCDGTLSHIEGIDELAKKNGVGEQVVKLTEDAMGRSGMSPELYQHRLDLVLPTAAQVEALGQLYFQDKTPDLLPVLQLLKALGKTVYIVSAGLLPAISHFATLLDIKTDNIFAVDIYFNAKGQYLDFDRNSPLVYANGKRLIVQKLKEQHPHLLYVGDGLNDYETHDLVTRFVGYGGAFYRENIEKNCQFYITAPSMAPLLPLCLTIDETANLTRDQLVSYKQGLAFLEKTSGFL
jgi:phosphoserine phosphatase